MRSVEDTKEGRRTRARREFNSATKCQERSSDHFVILFFLNTKLLQKCVFFLISGGGIWGCLEVTEAADYDLLLALAELWFCQPRQFLQLCDVWDSGKFSDGI